MILLSGWEVTALTESERIEAAIPRLLDWHRVNRRPLPWRDRPTPYAVWVSEIMLQQTRIEAAIPYYLRFMERLPDVKSLAEVSQEELLKLWEGLGYYSRARNLQKAAGIVMEQYGGTLPSSAQALRKLPGIGEYTAGAIASLAFGQPEPAVDGNVLRVILRLTARRDDALEADTRAWVTELLRGLYPTGKDAALLTEGLMELGETVCLPREGARCEACPLAALCLARERGEQVSLPVRSQRSSRRVDERTVLLLRCGERWAVRRRAEKGLLAGMWEFPNVEGCLSDKEILSQLSEQGLEPLSLEPWGEAKHLFTHVEWRMRGFLIPCANASDTYVWRTPEELRQSHAIPSAFRFWTKRIYE